MIKAGRPPEEAEAAGQLVAARYVSRAARFRGALGTALDLYKLEGPRIIGGRAAVREPPPETGAPPAAPEALPTTKEELRAYLRLADKYPRRRPVVLSLQCEEAPAIGREAERPADMRGGCCGRGVPVLCLARRRRSNQRRNTRACTKCADLQNRQRGKGLACQGRNRERRHKCKIMGRWWDARGKAPADRPS